MILDNINFFIIVFFMVILIHDDLFSFFYDSDSIKKSVNIFVINI